jgi:hypothetical protein
VFGVFDGHGGREVA